MSGLLRVSQPLAYAWRRRYVRLAAQALLWAAAAVNVLAVLAVLRRRTDQWDFSLIYVAALTMRRGLDPIIDGISNAAGDFGVFVGYLDRPAYSPFFLLCFEPFTFLGIRQAYWLWFALNLAVLIIALRLLFDFHSVLDRATRWTIVSLFLIYPPLTDHFYFAQTQLLILLAMVLMMRCLAVNRDVAAGLLLALASLLRVYPLAMFAYLLMRWRWRALLWTAAGLLSGAGVTMVMLGTARTFSFLAAMRSLAAGAHGRYDLYARFTSDVAVAPFVTRSFHYLWGPSLPHSVAVAGSVLTMAARSSLLISTVVATHKACAHDDADGRIFSLWLCSILLAGPLCWSHYMILLIIPFVCIMAAAKNGRASPRAIALATASFAFDVICRYTPWQRVLLPQPLGTGAGILELVASEAGFISLVLAFAATYYLVVDGTSAETATSVFDASAQRARRQPFPIKW